MARITLEVIVRAVFGIEQDEALHDVVEALRTVLDATSAGLVFVPALRRDLGPRSPYGHFTGA